MSGPGQEAADLDAPAPDDEPRAAGGRTGDGGLLAMIALNRAPDAAAPIVVEQGPSVTEMFGRRDVVVRARITLAAGPMEVALHAGDALAARLLLPGAAPAGPAPARCAALQMTRPASDAARRVPFRLVARSLDGSAEAEAAGVIATDAQAGARASVHGAATLQPGAAGDFAPDVILHVERAMVDPAGLLVVHGWALGLGPVAAVQIEAGGRPAGAARLGLYRSDVAKVFPSYPAASVAGFSFAAVLGEGAGLVAEVRVHAFTRDGACQTAVLPAEHAPRAARVAATSRVAPVARLSGGRAHADDARGVRLFCDRAVIGEGGRLTATGWAYSLSGLSGLAARLDGRTLDLAPLHPGALLAELRIEADGAALPAVLTLAATAEGGERGGEAAELSADVEAPADAAGADPAEPDLRLELDSPADLGTGAPTRVGGVLRLRGWALAAAGVQGVDVLLDGQTLGGAELGLERPDVLTAHPLHPDALHSGFEFAGSLRAVPNGEHALRIVVRDRAGKRFERRVMLLVEKPYATLKTALSLAERSLHRDVAARLRADAVISLILRQPGPPDAEAEALLGLTLDSLRAQVHTRWRLTVVADRAAEAAEWHRRVAGAHPDLAPRVAVTEAADPGAVDAPVRIGDGLRLTSAAIALIGLLGPGDVLGCDALAEVAVAHALHPEADLLYGDDIRRSPASGAAEPFFKPDWSPELLLSTNYIGRPWFARPGTVGADRRGVGAFVRGGEYDALLRATERAASIRHIPKLLCERRGPAEDAGAEASALSAAAARRGMDCVVGPGDVHGARRLIAAQPVGGLVSAVVPTRYAGSRIEACVAMLRALVTTARVEIVAVDTIPDDQPERKAWLAAHADVVVASPGPFNWSRLNNDGARAASGAFLLFLNDDVETAATGWLDPLLELASRAEVGVAGPRLLYPDGTVQHAGMFLARMGLARHAFRFAAADDPGYFGLARTQRDVSAVTGACMMMRREVFDAVGGFDEAHPVINNDLDFCLRVREAGYRVVYTPHATLTHHEGTSRKALAETYDAAGFARRWRTTFARGDPFHNPNLAPETDDFAPDEEPARAVQGGFPLFRQAEVERILAVKLDHIGDFVTALPALRLLRERFPAARITLLAGGFARALAEGEPSVDAFIPFDAYQARSQQGRTMLAAADYAALHARLAPHRFDLAVDLRKHPDAREVLRHVPARFLAGFDQDGAFPFLDVALEWAADRPLRRKRQHVSDDLVNLVDAVCHACRPEGQAPALRPPDLGLVRALLPPDAAALWDRPVVAIHPGVGNVMRQWPEEHFADLADLFTRDGGASVVLIGAREEQPIADAVLALVAMPDRVVSLVGRTSLRDLERLLPQCALYVGNNSGPHHIAAALGVPTVGVHSGVVDPAEWAPAGPRAVALSKRMACSPCYRATPEQCHRDLACLRLLSPATVHRWGEMLMARQG